MSPTGIGIGISSNLQEQGIDSFGNVNNLVQEDGFNILLEDGASVFLTE